MSAAQVYRAFDAAGRLLYVGCSADMEARLRYHAQHAAWWPFHVSIERVPYDSREEALAAEAEAIATEHPRWNMQGRAADHPDGAATNLPQATWLDYELDVSRRVRKHRESIAVLQRDLRRATLALRAAESEASMISAGLADLDEDCEAAS